MSEHNLPSLPDEGDAVATLISTPAPPEPDSLSADMPMAPDPVASLPAFSPPVPPAEALALVARGLAPGADESTRSAARELWTRVAHLLVAPTPAAPVPPPMPALPPMPSVPITPLPVPPGVTFPKLPATPVATAVRALQQIPPDQLLELLLARLRAALPNGVTVPAPTGIQFQLVPVAPSAR